MTDERPTRGIRRHRILATSLPGVTAPVRLSSNNGCLSPVVALPPYSLPASWAPCELGGAASRCVPRCRQAADRDVANLPFPVVVSTLLQAKSGLVTFATPPPSWCSRKSLSNLLQSAWPNRARCEQELPGRRSAGDTQDLRKTGGSPRFTAACPRRAPAVRYPATSRK